MDRKMEIESRDIEFDHDANSDAGDCYIVTCPVCFNKIRIAQYGWWEKKCSCGYMWSIEIKAIGEK